MKNQFQWFRKKDGIYIAILLLLLLGGTHGFERLNVWHPVREMREHPSDKGITFEDVYFETSDGVRLNGWYFPSADTARASVLFCHGRGGNLSSEYAHVRLLQPLGVHVFLFDYRGYGKSRGFTTENGTYRDARAAYDWLRQKTPDLPIVIHGRSLGAAIATDLATRVPAAALISENGFCSIPAVGKDRFPYLPTSLLCWVRYNAEAKIGNINMPLLIIHSREDATVLYHHGERLYAAAKEPKRLVTLEGGHDCAFVSTEAYSQAIADWIESFVLGGIK